MRKFKSTDYYTPKYVYRLCDRVYLDGLVDRDLDEAPPNIIVNIDGVQKRLKTFKATKAYLSSIGIAVEKDFGERQEWKISNVTVKAKSIVLRVSAFALVKASHTAFLYGDTLASFNQVMQTVLRVKESFLLARQSVNLHLNKITSSVSAPTHGW